MYCLGMLCVCSCLYVAFFAFFEKSEIHERCHVNICMCKSFSYHLINRLMLLFFSSFFYLCIKFLNAFVLIFRLCPFFSFFVFFFRLLFVCCLCISIYMSIERVIEAYLFVCVKIKVFKGKVK